MKKQISTILVLLLTASSGFALDDLVPATNEDMAQFDRQLGEQRSAKPQDRQKVSNAIAEEAKKLKDASKEDRKGFGKWVSDQKRKSETGRPDSAGIDKANGPGSGGGGKSAEARGRGHGSENAPGRGRKNK